MRFGFVGTVEGSAVAFEALVAAGMPPSLLVTLPREAAARHSDYYDLARPARELGIAVHEARNVNSPETIAALWAADLDLVLVLGWSQICHEEFRQVARHGSLGFHPAPLPRFRGRAVIPWTILRGETMTGSTLFWLDEGVDSGAVMAQRTFAVAPNETARSLYDKHLGQIREMVPETLRRIASGDHAGIAQDHSLASYCAKRTMEDGLIDWSGEAGDILRLIRAVGDPYPGSFTHLSSKRLVIETARFYLDADRYIGMPGQVVAHTDDGFVVACGGKTALEVTQWRGGSADRPKLHVKFSSADWMESFPGLEDVANRRC